MIHAIVPGLENLKCPKVKEPFCGSLTLGRRFCDFGSLTPGHPLSSKSEESAEGGAFSHEAHYAATFEWTLDIQEKRPKEKDPIASPRRKTQLRHRGWNPDRNALRSPNL